MTSENSGKRDDSEQGPGLPVGFEWRPRHRYSTEAVCDLFCDGADVGEEAATVWADGAWKVWGPGTAVLAEGHAKSRSGAGAAVEVAMWAHDWFGVGEVRGVGLPLEEFELHIAMVKRGAIHLPGLPGEWRVTAVRPVEGGIEVDAVRAPVAEPAPVDDPTMPERNYGEEYARASAGRNIR